METIKHWARRMMNVFGFEIHRIGRPSGTGVAEIADSEYYRPLFSPWLGYGEFGKYYALAKERTIVSPDRCWVLYSLCRQSLVIDGDVWECGVYRGGTAAMLAQLLADCSSDKRLHLFDTFRGMPETDLAVDRHRQGDFSDTTLKAVRGYVKHEGIALYHEGFIPETFRGMGDARIAFSHIDVDIRSSVADCCEFIFPRLSVGGFMVFDDYGFPSCPGARKAVDDYFAGRNAVPLVLPTGQAVVFKSK